MNVHELTLQNYAASGGCPSACQPILYLGTAGSYGNEQINVVLGEGWQGLTVKAVFQPSGVPVVVPDGGGVISVPWEATQSVIAYPKGRISFQGYVSGRLVNTSDVPYTVGGSSAGSDNTPAPTPDEFQQFVDAVKSDADRAAQAAADAEAAVQKVTNAGTQAVTDIGNAKDSALEAIDVAREEAAGSISADVEGAKQAAAQAEQSAKDAAASASGVAQSGQQAVQSIKDAQTAAEQAIDTAKQQAVQAAQAEAEKAATSAGQAASSAAEAAQSATNAAAEVGKVQSAGTAAVQAVQAAKNTATEAVSAAQQTATQTVSEAQATAVSAVQEAGTTQTSTVASAASSALTNISGAKDAALSDVAEAGAAQVSAVGTAGTGAVQDVNDAKTAALEEIDAANAALPSPTQSDAGKVPTVKADGSAYELAGPYAPLSAAIRPTANGNPVSITDSVEWPLLGLKVYGKSTQDGTPSPENPVPIVSAGGGGSIVLTVSDGADQSQSLTLSTPNGLPGIPVDSGGNYTDAEGQQLVCSYVNFAKQKYFNVVQKTVFHTGANWYFDSFSGRAGYTGLRNIIKAPETNSVIATLVCDHYKTVSANSTYNKNTGISVQSEGSSAGTIFLYDPKFTSLDEFTNWFNDNTLTIVYELATITETDIPTEELAAYRTLHTYDGATVVSTAEDVAGLEVRYIADAQKYIDDRLTAVKSHIQEIAAAQLNAQTGG